MSNFDTTANPVATSEAGDATALGVAAAATAIRNGEMSSENYATALLRQARENADLDAFISIDEAAVLSSARNADKARTRGATAPLLGVPLGVKDSYLTQGLRTTLGIGNLRDFVPDRDATVVQAIKAAGGIVFGKNNLVEMSYGLTGHNGAHGQARNPRGRAHVTGGSSSGAGASVGAHIVPAALGGDTVGSIRVPASFCGVVGFKPGLGRWSGDGVAPISHVLDTPGVLARSVEDCSLIDQVVTGALPQASPLRTGLDGVRLAYAPRQHLERIDADVERAFRETLRRLRDAGADVFEIDLGDDFFAATEAATWTIFLRETMPAISEFLHHHRIPTSFDDIFNALKPGLRDAWANLVLPDGAGFATQDAYFQALNVHRPEVQRRFDAVFTGAGADALLLPTTPRAAPLIEQQASFTIAGEEVDDLALARHTVAASLAGLPGISLPMGVSDTGLPVGLELDGAAGSDRRLLDVARRVEAALG
jgi:mandelamide amidase